MPESSDNVRKILDGIVNDFSPDKVVRFFREKNRNAFAPVTEDLSQYGDDYFRNGSKLGEIQFARDEKMLICAFEATKSLSERSGKKAQYEKGKKILKGSNADAGIFIFYDPQGDFRFSLIYANYMGTRRDWSVFRRFTYFVGKEFTNKTFLQRIDNGDFSSLEKIKEAFSVEKVTKAFYTEIANWYFWAVQHTKFPDGAEREENGRKIAVIRMITRLIFIWFMKERGLVSQALFNHENITNLLKDVSPTKTTYYKAILQNLFFATLNTRIRDRAFRFSKSFQGRNKNYMDHSIYRYEDYFKNREDMLDVFRDIPFLNGGLFDCLDRRDVQSGKNIEIRIDGFTDKEVGLNIPNFLFFSDETTADLNEEFDTKNKKYKVRGLIDILSSYNFTTDENDPNDQEVALDPELLGKVFENLLASFNQETESTARKATGSYYTPREQGNSLISEFMGIDLDADSKENGQRMLIRDETDVLITQFRQKKNEYQNEPDRVKKDGLKKDVDDLIIAMFEAKLKKQKADYFRQLQAIEKKYSVLPNENKRNEIIAKEKKKLCKQMEFDLETVEKQLHEFTCGLKAKPFFAWKLYFAEVFQDKGGFDIVIANPPYVNVENLDSQTKKYLFEHYETCKGRTDIYIAFIEMASSLLRQQGIFSYIIPYAYTNQNYGSLSRKMLIDKYSIKEIVDTSEYFVFETATVKNIIINVTKSNKIDVTKIKIAKSENDFY